MRQNGHQTLRGHHGVHQPLPSNCFFASRAQSACAAMSLHGPALPTQLTDKGLVCGSRSIFGTGPPLVRLAWCCLAGRSGVHGDAM
jgi:hypothetical protein